MMESFINWFDMASTIDQIERVKTGTHLTTQLVASSRSVILKTKLLLLVPAPASAPFKTSDAAVQPRTVFAPALIRSSRLHSLQDRRRELGIMTAKPIASAKILQPLVLSADVIRKPSRCAICNMNMIATEKTYRWTTYECLRCGHIQTRSIE
jgi:hypothetical protein